MCSLSAQADRVWALLDAAVHKLATFLQLQDGSTEVAPWHFELALILVAEGFHDPSHLAGACPASMAKLSPTAKGKALLSPAVSRANERHQQSQLQRAKGVPTMAAAHAVQFAEALSSVTPESTLPGGNPTMVCKTLQDMAPPQCHMHLQTAVTHLKLQTKCSFWP